MPAAVPAKRTRPMMSHMRWLALHPIKSMAARGPGPTSPAPVSPGG